MSAQKRSDWLITITILDDYDSEGGMALQELLNQYPKYYCIKENADSGSDVYKIAVWDDKILSQQGMCKRWKKATKSLLELELDQEYEHSVKVKPLDGEELKLYFENDNTHVMWSNISETRKKTPILSEMCDEVIRFAEQHKLDLNTSDDFEKVLQKMMQSEYALSIHLDKMKYVWIQIRCIRGIKVSDDEW